MQKQAALFTESESAIPLPELEKLVQNWLVETELSDRSARTLKSRKDILHHLVWFLKRRQFTDCGVSELRAFFLYLQRGHLEPGGRWENPAERQPLKAGTLKTYHSLLRAFLNFGVAEGRLVANPMSRISAPLVRDDEVMPFSVSEIELLRKAARKSQHPARDEAILLTLFDTGIRANELCNLRFADVDFTTHMITIREGKGQKSRPAYIGKDCYKLLWKYVQIDGRDEQDSLFLSQQGSGLSYNGLRMLFERLERASGVKNCHCHRFRHSFALSFLTNGGNQMSLCRLLGHTDLKTTARYVQLASADLERQHRQFSPVDSLKKGKGR